MTDTELDKILIKINSLLDEYWLNIDLHIIELENADDNVSKLGGHPKIQRNPHKREFTALIDHFAGKRHSGLFGIVSKEEKLNLFNKSKRKFDALIILRPPRDQIEEIDYEYRLLHYLWHTIDLALNIRDKGSCSEIQDNIFIAQNNRLHMSKRNMEADIFASVVLKKFGRPDVINQIAKHYAKASVTADAGVFPERYPFLNVYDLTFKSFGIYKDRLESENEPILKLASDITHNIVTTCGLDTIKTWDQFCSGAQELVWNDTPVEQVLGAAIDLSPEPEIRMSAYTVAEFLEIDVPRMQKSENWYNVFADEQTQLQLYQKFIDYSFTMCMERAVTSGQGQAFIDLANIQNEKLAKGSFFGWCAPCLQAVGTFITNGSFQGEFPKELARMHFEAAKKEFDINEIQNIGRILLQERRKGHVIDIKKLYKFVEGKKMSEAVVKSVKQTLVEMDQYEGNERPVLDGEIRNHWDEFGKAYEEMDVKQI